MSLSRIVKVGDREISVPVTLADQIVNWVNPSKGAERYRVRARMAMLGGYTSADKSRRANQRGSVRETDADGAILPDLGTLREDSQHMLRNSPLAGAAINTNITKVVGTGLKAKAQIDRSLLRLTDDQADAWERAAEREFRLATNTVEIDAERCLDFYGLQSLAFLKTLEDGDVFVNMPRFARNGSPYRLKLQLIEAARVCNPDGKQDADGLVAGIEKDDKGAPLTYHVASRHPGSAAFWMGRDKITWEHLNAFGEKTGAPLVLHLFDKTRPGQTRGVPYLAPVIELIKQLGRYTDAEVMAAVVSGMMTVFVHTETGEPEVGENMSEDSDPYDTDGMELGYGSVIGLRPDSKVESFNPNRPNTAFDPFITAVTRQIGARLEIPFELLIKHFTSSYSASRAALEEAWDYFSRRRNWLAGRLCRPVYEAVITEAVANGRLKAPGFFADPRIRAAWLGAEWNGDAPSQIDPVKEIEAAKRRVELRISTRAEECTRLTGGDWESKLPQMVREEKLLADGKIPSTISPDPAATEAALQTED